MKRLWLGIMLAIAAGTAAAQGAAASCAEDLHRYCAQSGNDMDCLLDHYKEVSDACYSALKRQVSSDQNAHAPAEGKSAAAEPERPCQGKPVGSACWVPGSHGQLVPGICAAPTAGLAGNCAVIDGANGPPPATPVVQGGSPRQYAAGARSGQDARECLRFDDAAKIRHCAEQFR